MFSYFTNISLQLQVFSVNYGLLFCSHMLLHTVNVLVPDFKIFVSTHKFCIQEFVVKELVTVSEKEIVFFSKRNFQLYCIALHMRRKKNSTFASLLYFLKFSFRIGQMPSTLSHFCLR